MQYWYCRVKGGSELAEAALGQGAVGMAKSEEEFSEFKGWRRSVNFKGINRV